MQIAPVPGIGQPPPLAASAAAPPVGAAAPVAPMEPERRVTANRHGGRGESQGQQQAPKAPPAQTRGRLIDLSV